MLNEEKATETPTRTDPAQDQSVAPTPTPKRLKLENVHAASVDLLGVAHVVVSITPDIQQELKPGSTAWMRFAVLRELADRAIAKAEGAL